MFQVEGLPQAASAHTVRFPWTGMPALTAHALPPFRLETYFARWEFNARYHLSASDAQALPLAALLDLASPEDRAAWEALPLGYTETRGGPGLLEAIASTYESISPAELLCFAGAEEAIYSAMHTILRPGDHTITIIPNYQSLESVPLTLGEVTGIPLDPESNWDLDLDRVRDAIRPSTRLLCINFPHNPTGKVIARSALDGLVALAREHGFYLFSDEVYRGVERDPARRLPQVADLYEKGLSLGVMSKAYGLPGLRIGWVACQDAAVLQRMEEVKHYLSICNSAPSEWLAMIALKAADQILQRNRGLIKANLHLLDAFFARHTDRFEWRLPDGGCIGYPRYLGPEGVERFTQSLVETAGVLLLPASIFQSALGPTPTDRFRIGYGRSGLAEGLAALETFLAREG